MTLRFVAAVAACAALMSAVGVLAQASAADASTSTVVCHLADPRIDEASGLGVGVVSPGIDYVENDSGDVNRFFALNAKTGETAAVVTVPHAVNVDWEDLAVAPDAAGAPSVWLGDIGDNDAVRREVTVYRVDEPKISPSDHDQAVTASQPDVWRLRYPSGPVNAEALAVTPRGVAYIITKSVIGYSEVYRLPPHPDAEHVQNLVRVGSIQFSATATGTPEGRIGTLTATSASVSRNGSLMVVRTYSDAYIWRLHGVGGFAAAIKLHPTRVMLPIQRQGEGIAFHGATLLVDSEGVGTAVDRVPLPATLARAAVAAAGARSYPRHGSPARRNGSSAGRNGAAARGRAGAQLVADEGVGGPPAGLIAVAAVVLCLILGFAGVAVVRRRRAHPVT